MKNNALENNKFSSRKRFPLENNEGWTPEGVGN